MDAKKKAAVVVATTVAAAGMVTGALFDTPADFVNAPEPDAIVENMAEELTVRFRVGAVYRNAFIGVYFDDERVVHRKRLMMAPGEMEEVKLKKEQLEKYPELTKITVKVEAE